MAAASNSFQHSERKRAQIQVYEAERMEKLQQMCMDLGAQTSKWRFPPQSESVDPRLTQPLED
ncbi:protein of unknown function (plasmid) [Pararobbsia alpina]